MISTKRQIRRDDDRYGGYGASGDTSLASEYGIIGETEYYGTSMLRTDDIDITNSAAPEPAPAYTSPIESAAPAPTVTEVPPPPAVTERPAKHEIPHSREDVLPTLKTRSYATASAETAEAPVASDVIEEKEVARRERRGLSSREKMMLCIYVAIALVLAIAVIATGVSISAASVQSDTLVGQIEQKQAVISVQESELAVLRDEGNIRSRAAESGMVQAGSPEYYAPVAEDVGYPEATPHTNGFDEFMDWMSNIL